ncbi:GtrA family protein [Sphingomonas lacunae]|nr:GtrA family protein [Sphingomonas lacunae]
MQRGIIARLVALMTAAMRGEVTWLRYLLASIIALLTDTGLFMLLFHMGMAAVMASAIGYCTGIAVHWLISSRTVFAENAAARGTGQRNAQKALFVGSALVGLAITMAIVGAADMAGFDPRLAKLAAIIVSFQATYMLRRHVVFRA